jgi:hypothetical protein
MKEDEMGKTCGTHGRDQRMHTQFWLENMKGGNHFEDFSVGGRII